MVLEMDATKYSVSHILGLELQQVIHYSHNSYRLQTYTTGMHSRFY